MHNLKFLLLSMAAAGTWLTGAAQAAGQPSQQRYGDPFVEHRNAEAEASRRFKAGDITMEQYEKLRGQAKERLEASGQRGLFERNLEAGGRWRTGR